ncbi:hypothetical protein KIW84_020904 [Lathyrus oleraceus]|uniref:Uncharacterized protein n=1 Tax=Pisum sativum TaxID=3888 RepID=A0A9D5B392_PEA|nr:hypothetical protein KIW84_020904 [Pisum sativum]
MAFPSDESIRAPDGDSADVTELVLWVQGKKIEFGWKNINKVLKCKNLQPTTKQTPSKMLVVDMAPIPKAWPYYMYHTLDTNRSGSDLIAERALALYFLLKCQPVNIDMISAADMNVVARSPKKSLEHVTMILLLYQKGGVNDLDGRQMFKPTRSLDPAWLKENTIERAE